MATPEPNAPTVPTKVCPHCGVQSQTTADKCPSCGKSYKVKVKKRGGCLRIIAGLIGLIVVIAIIASLAGGKKDEGTVSKGNGNTSGSSNSGSATAGIGDTLTLKGTSYKVTAARKAKSVGNSFSKTTADGIFVIVNLTITNRKDEPKTILADNVRIRAGNGNEYNTSDKAFAAFDNQLTVLQEIQPQLPKKVVAVYDIPPGAVKGAKLVVKDLFSDSEGEIKLGLR